jgi:orotidine-5'-phosphate decarboxylase
MDRDDLEAMGITLDVPDLALARARQAVAAGCDGVIASALEAERLREALGPEPLIVTPGIRPGGQSGGDDQKRVASPASAFRSGADYIVVGRPIRDAADPRAAALVFQREIAVAFE